MKEQVLKALNEQINYEYYSAYIYLQMGLIMERNNYKGYAKWLMDHYKEELDHAQEFIDFVLIRDSTPVLKDIEVNFIEDISDLLEVAKIIYDHERKVSKRIYELHDIAKEHVDYATEIFMHKFINEQIEEEDVTKDIVDRFTLAADDVAARMITDDLLGKL